MRDCWLERATDEIVRLCGRKRLLLEVRVVESGIQLVGIALSWWESGMDRRSSDASGGAN